MGVSFIVESCRRELGRFYTLPAAEVYADVERFLLEQDVWVRSDKVFVRDYGFTETGVISVVRKPVYLVVKRR